MSPDGESILTKFLFCNFHKKYESRLINMSETTFCSSKSHTFLIRSGFPLQVYKLRHMYFEPGYA
jgi:hypothetical protein